MQVCDFGWFLNLFLHGILYFKNSGNRQVFLLWVNNSQYFKTKLKKNVKIVSRCLCKYWKKFLEHFIFILGFVQWRKKYLLLSDQECCSVVVKIFLFEIERTNTKQAIKWWSGYHQIVCEKSSQSYGKRSLLNRNVSTSWVHLLFRSTPKFTSFLSEIKVNTIIFS